MKDPTKRCRLQEGEKKSRAIFSQFQNVHCHCRGKAKGRRGGLPENILSREGGQYLMRGKGILPSGEVIGQENVGDSRFKEKAGGREFDLSPVKVANTCSDKKVLAREQRSERR